MTDATDNDRTKQEGTQPEETQQADANHTRQDATAVPDERRNASENRDAEKPEMKSPARENLERVGVDEEHKTEAMRKHQRGTFP